MMRFLNNIFRIGGPVTTPDGKHGIDVSLKMPAITVIVGSLVIGTCGFIAAIVALLV